MRRSNAPLFLCGRFSFFPSLLLNVGVKIAIINRTSRRKEDLELKYVRRFVWYIAFRLLIICCILGLMTTAFYFAMNAANIQIILKDGMARRAQVVMMGENEKELGNYFSNAYIARDPLVTQARNGESVYLNYYNITGIDHRLHMDFVWCWPWEDTARATMRESIPRIDGKVKSSMRDTVTQLGLTASPPRWQSAEYSVLLSRENGRWIIKNMTVTEVINE